MQLIDIENGTEFTVKWKTWEEFYSDVSLLMIKDWYNAPLCSIYQFKNDKDKFLVDFCIECYNDYAIVEISRENLLKYFNKEIDYKALIKSGIPNICIYFWQEDGELGIRKIEEDLNIFVDNIIADGFFFKGYNTFYGNLKEYGLN